MTAAGLAVPEDVPLSVIVCVALEGGLTAGRQDVPAGQYLAGYNPEAHGGRGEAAWTPDPAGAMTFPNAKAAFACWRQVPRSRPVRPDGKPNRPLTAFTVAIVPAPGGQAR